MDRDVVTYYTASLGVKINDILSFPAVAFYKAFV